MSQPPDIEALHEMPEFLALSAQQRIFAETFLITHDRNKAARTAYNPANANAVNVAGWKAMHSPKIIRLLERVKADSEPKHFTHYIDDDSPRRPSAPASDNYPPSEYDETCRAAVDVRMGRAGLQSMAMLLEVPKFMTGGTGKFVSPDDWQCQKYGTFNLTVLVDERIRELGLSAKKVWEFPFVRGFFADWRAEQRFWSLPLEQRVERFK